MKPIISVVIPCKNEEKYIEKCIRSVYTNMVEGFDIEVIVCDGVSEDQTPNIVESLRNEYPLLQFQINHKQYTPFALNLGIENARGDYICILGAHATMKPDFLSSCYKIFSNDSAIGCVGGILNNTYENDISEAIGLAMNSSFGVGNAHFRTGNYEGYVDTVAFGLYKKEVFKKVGLFDPYLIRNQDDDFNFRLTKNGYKLYLINKVVSDYAVRGSFKKLYKQYYQYGYWKVYVNKKHQNITTFRQLVPFFFVYTLSRLV
jgi:cellulose synthase/poly-beta-1,6-N-acetylglucosamine synthase-like glycosyltransferase